MNTFKRPRNGKRKAENERATRQLAQVRAGGISAKNQRKLCIADALASEVQKKIAALKSELVGVSDAALVWTPQFRRVVRIMEQFGRWMTQVNSDISKLKAKAGVKAAAVLALISLAAAGCHTTSAGWPRWGFKPAAPVTLVTNVTESLHPSGQEKYRVEIVRDLYSNAAIATNAYRIPLKTPRDPLNHKPK